MAEHALKITGLALAVVVFALPQSARAHAGPQVRDIFTTSVGQREVLLTNRGLIFGSGDNASDWSLMCNEALGIGTSESPDLAVFADGRIMANTTNGLLQSSDGGCSWLGVEPFSMLSTPGLRQDPKDPERVYITTFGSGQGGVRVTPDGGRSWQTLLMVDDNDYMLYVHVAPRDPNRVYVRSLRFGDDGGFVYSVLRSDDAGHTWQRSRVEIDDEKETDFVLLGVSPINSDLVVAMAEAADPIAGSERLYVSRDGGKTFENPITLQVITRVAWSEDGTLYVASDEGLYKSTDEGKTLHRVGSAEYLSCVIEREGALLVCGYYAGIPAGNPGIGISRDGGETFTRYMNLNMVAQPLKCDPMSTTGSACALPWTDWQNELLIGLDGGVPLAGGPGLAGAAGAAGSADAGIAAGQSGAPSAGTSALDAGLAGSGAATARSAASGCSCQLTGGPAPLPRTAAVGFGIAVLLLRSRRRRLVRRDQDQRSDPDRPTSGAFGAKLPSQCAQPELERTRWHSR